MLQVSPAGIRDAEASGADREPKVGFRGLK
jgi:hypothetical protein